MDVFCLAKVPTPPPVPRNNKDSTVNKRQLTNGVDGSLVGVTVKWNDTKDGFVGFPLKENACMLMQLQSSLDPTLSQVKPMRWTVYG